VSPCHSLTSVSLSLGASAKGTDMSACSIARSTCKGQVTSHLILAQISLSTTLRTVLARLRTVLLQSNDHPYSKGKKNIGGHSLKRWKRFSVTSRMQLAQKYRGNGHFLSAASSSRHKAMVGGALVRASAFRVGLGVSGTTTIVTLDVNPTNRATGQHSPVPC
jgi:hypothetical protein